MAEAPEGMTILEILPHNYDKIINLSKDTARGEYTVEDLERLRTQARSKNSVAYAMFMNQDFWLASPVRTCTHCLMELKVGTSGHWTHVNNLSRCQNPDVPYGHLAHPADVPCWADGPNPCMGAFA